MPGSRLDVSNWFLSWAKHESGRSAGCISRTGPQLGPNEVYFYRAGPGFTIESLNRVEPVLGLGSVRPRPGFKSKPRAVLQDRLPPRGITFHLLSQLRVTTKLNDCPRIREEIILIPGDASFICDSAQP